MNVFHVDAYGILTSLFNKVKGMISGNKKVAPSEIDEAVNSTIQEHATEVSPEQAQEGYQALQKMQANQQADDGKVYSSLELMHDAKMIRLAMMQYEYETLRLTKTAVNKGSFLSGFTGTRAKGTNIIAKIFGWVFRIALGSAGLMIGGDLIRHFVGMDHPSEQEVPPPQGPTSSQTKYKLIGDTPLPRQMPLSNTPDNIGNMIVQFAKDVYSGLDGKENLIRNTPGFRAIKEKIVWNNVYNPGSRTTMMPAAFTSKKQIVDYFIDEVAKADKA